MFECMSVCVCVHYPLSAELSHGSTSTAESKWQLLCLTVLSALRGNHTSPIPQNIIKTRLDTHAHAHRATHTLSHHVWWVIHACHIVIYSTLME